ncbi:MAG TPA: lipid-A-disaccharide synthase-related protein [Bacillota bacterium]|nr:lipid-A-disaccharide synthase-related protein [Bacillota bacterium]
MKKLLFISNGHGEDLIAARLAKPLLSNEGLEIKALPIVGVGSAYSAIGVPLIMGGENMPSGGFIRNGPRNLVMDLRAGLFELTRRQIKVLKVIGPEIDLAICVGDSLLTFLGGFYLKRPMIFLPTAKSDFVSSHWAIERWLMKRFCTKVFPRDQITAANLAGYGIPAEFAGNVMMDSLDFMGPDLNGVGNQWVIGILPGSRSDAYINLEDISKVVVAFEKLKAASGIRRPVKYLVALSGGLAFAEVSRYLASFGWAVIEPDPDERQRGIVGYLEYSRPEFSARLSFTQGRFADVLQASQAVIGLAGTANEQAVGLGKPVVTFVGRGSQFTKKFVRTQKKLLGDSVSVVGSEPGTVAKELLAILMDDSRHARMAQIGWERMGDPGAVKRITAEIQASLNEKR